MKNKQKQIISKIFLTCTSTVFLLLFSALTNYSQNKPQRVINTVPQRLPIKVEITNGDFDSKLEELKVKVTNKGEKPIYYLSLNVSSIEKSNGRKLGVTSFKYGNFRLGDFSRSADFNAVEREKTLPLKNSETIEFSVTKKEVEGFDRLLQQAEFQEITKLEVKLAILSFGDGTGFLTQTGVPYPQEDKQALNFFTVKSSSFFLTF